MYICGHMVHSSGMEYRVCFSFAFGRSIRFCLYGLGILAVLLPKGYPLLGITIGCLGMVLCLFSLTGFGFTLLWRSDGKRKKDRERPEGIRGDENQDIEGFGLEVEGEQHA